MKDVFLVLAGAIMIASAWPYMRDILRGTTKPNLVSWITWTLLAGIATAAEIAGGEYRTAIFTGTVAIETTLVIALGLKHGYVKYTSIDVVCQIGAIVGIILWQIFDSPAVGVIASVVVDIIGATPTFRHSWFKPFEETWLTYAMASISGVFAILALTAYNWTSLTYAIYIVIMNAAITFILLTRSSVVRLAKS